MTAPIVERVARAVCIAMGEDPDRLIRCGINGYRSELPYWTVRIPEARASIREMHTMVEEVITALEPLAVYGRPDSRDVDTAKTIESIAALRELLKDTK